MKASADDTAVGEAEGDGHGDRDSRDADAIAAFSGRADGDGCSLTRMPQPASSVAAPTPASTPARHLGLTSASSMLFRVFRRGAAHTLATARV